VSTNLTRTIKNSLFKTQSSRPIVVSAPNQILWALIGLFLTIGGTFVEAFVTTNVPWNWADQGVQIQSLGVTYQIGAVLLTGCLGGKNAGALSQIAYVVIGLTLLPVFSQGGGLAYLKEPSFGYLLGFIPGAWICGLLAFRAKATLESLAFSSVCGLVIIHLVGVIYLFGLSLLNLRNDWLLTLIETITKYSINPVPSQMTIVCSVAVIAFIMRKILFY
jgi:biotin transport system substrate-specific component